MAQEHGYEDEIVQFVSQHLKEQFDASLSTVEVIITKPFITVHLLGFSFPAEETLLKLNGAKKIMETRDLLLKGWKDELREKLSMIVGGKVEQIYADWNLENKTGMMVAVLERSEGNEVATRIDEKVEKKLKEHIIEISKKTEKAPEKTKIYWLNDRVVMVERNGIMVDIEKELIKNGAIEELRLAKRPLEHRLMDALNTEETLKLKVQELFVDWDFEGDIAYMVLILEK